VAIQAGAFLMGGEEGLPDARPVHEVWVDAFRLAATPATNADSRAYVQATGIAPPPFWSATGFDGDAQPVVGLSWDEAVVYAAWAGARLPTEAEWERAARGGLAGARYPWGGARPDATFRHPPRAGSTAANPFGLRDLSGVCHEWCADWYDAAYYGRSPARNPRGPERGDRRVSRGGAWRHADPWSQVSHRSSLPPGLRYSDYGVRLAGDA